MHRRFERELIAARLKTPTVAGAAVTDAEINALPPVVRRYLEFMGVPGRPRDWSLRAHLFGRFRPSPTQPWMPLESWQYNSALDVARFFHLRIHLYGVLPVIARDEYSHGRGRMKATALRMATLVDARGHELDVGELVTYVNDAILMAPSMLLGPTTSWHALSDDAFEVRFRDCGHVVTAQVTIDERGAPREFATTDRFIQDPYHPDHPFVRTRWSTPIDGWRIMDGRPLPTAATAIWHLPQGDFSYAQINFTASHVAFDVAPDEAHLDQRESA
jgi:hypothetical protein